jgi:hypothetical protein
LRHKRKSIQKVRAYTFELFWFTSKRLPKNDSICEQKLSLSIIPIPFFEKESSGYEFNQPTLVTSKNTSIESIHTGSPMCENKSFVDQENVLMSNLEIGDQEFEGEDKT